MYHVMPQPTSGVFRLGILLPLLLLASPPLMIYFQLEQQSYLLAAMIILIVVQFVLNIRTASMAVGVMSQLQKMGGNWDLLVLTGVCSQSLPRTVWIAVIRRTWIDHVLLVLPRLGIAYGFMQFLHTEWLFPYHYYSHPSIFWVFNYYSYNYGQPPIIYPDMLQVLITLGVLIAYSVAGTAIAAMMGVFWGSFLGQRKSVTVSAVAMGNVLGIILCVFLFFALPKAYSIRKYIIEYESNSFRYDVWACEAARRIEFDGGPSYTQEKGRELRAEGLCDDVLLEQLYFHAVEATQVTMSSFVDQGVLLAANILRPINHHVGGYDFKYYGYYLDNEWNWKTSYWPFVLRNVLSAVLAFMIYGLLIGCSLVVAGLRLRRHGFE